MIDPDRLHTHLTRRLPVALDALRQMVDTNSFTHNAAGVNHVGDLTADLFAPLGFVAERRQAIECAVSETPPLGQHLFLRHVSAAGPRVGLVGHLDTVFTDTDEVANDFRWCVSGERIYGPGTVDMKGGNVLVWMVIDALHTLWPAVFERIDLRPMFNAAEEGLASQFLVLARDTIGADASACLVFEGGEFEHGTHYLINRRKGSVELHAVAHGRSAHAGGQHQRGANAIVQLSDLILRLHALTDYASDLTCNIGVVRGGTVVNQIPDLAEALIELRAFEPDILNAAFERAMQMNGLSTVTSAADGFKALIELTCRLYHRPWPINPWSESLLRIAQAAGRDVGLVIDARGRGGLSDGNFLWHTVPTIDGLGPVGANLHCAVRSTDGSADQEYVLRDSFVPKAMLAVRIIEHLGLSQP